MCVGGSNGGDGGEVRMKDKHEERQPICFLGNLIMIESPVCICFRWKFLSLKFGSEWGKWKRKVGWLGFCNDFVFEFSQW